MSYEGYEQVLCKNGHLSTEDAYFFDTNTWECPICKEKATFVHGVDQTNCGGHPIPFKEKSKKTCGECGHIKEVTYYEPTSTDIMKFELTIECEHCGLGSEEYKQEIRNAFNGLQKIKDRLNENDKENEK